MGQVGIPRSPCAMAKDNRWYCYASQSFAFLHSKSLLFYAVFQLIILQSICFPCASSLVWLVLSGRYQNQSTSLHELLCPNAHLFVEHGSPASWSSKAWMLKWVRILRQYFRIHNNDIAIAVISPLISFQLSWVMLSTLEENRVVLVPQGKQPIQNPMPANKRAGLSISKFDANVNTGRFPRSDTFIKTKGDFFSPFDQPVEGFYPPSSDGMMCKIFITL